jgi:hypothetical protein
MKKRADMVDNTPEEAMVTASPRVRRASTAMARSVATAGETAALLLARSHEAADAR